MLKIDHLPTLIKNTLRVVRSTKNFLRKPLLKVSNYAFGKSVANQFRIRFSLSHKTNPTYEELIETVPDSDLPVLDRQTLTINQLTPEQRTWRENGYLILPKFIPNELLDAYIRVREKISFSGGYKTPIPYMDVEEIKDLCLYKPLMEKLELLIGEPMGMHLNLRGG